MVGTGQSGCQIAEELYQSGRKVYLCVSGAMRVPRRYRGRDSISWLVDTGFFDQKPDMLSMSRDRFKAHPFLTGKDGGRSLDLHQFARDGVTLLGHMAGADGTQITFLRTLSSDKVAVMLVPSLGGHARKLAESLSPTSLGEAGALLPPFLAWSGDGEHLVVAARENSGRPFALAVRTKSW